MPTFDVTPLSIKRLSGEYVVMPAHINGATTSGAKEAGGEKTQEAGYLIILAKPPLSLPGPA